MLFSTSWMLFAVFLFFSSILSGFSTALQRLGRIGSKEAFKKHSKAFFYQYFLRIFHGTKGWEGLFFALSFSKHLALLCYAAFAFYSLLTEGSPQAPASQLLEPLRGFIWLSVVISVSLVSDFLMRLIASGFPQTFFRLFSFLTSLFLLALSPITVCLYYLVEKLFPFMPAGSTSSKLMREKFLEILDETALLGQIDAHEQKLILAVASFKEKIAREVMVPRVDVFNLSSDTTVQKAAEYLSQERYSRIPVFKENLDSIIGVLHHKDLLQAMISSPPSDWSRMTIEPLIKPIIYAPETKKISHLLQEFRSKQSHMALVVDEYGGTEGIVTIEDILEELVGEISDEYDIDQEKLYLSHPAGGWAVDAKMSINDIEKELGIQIPHGPEYETVGGYVFHLAGTIPTKGWKMHHDLFDLEVLESDEKSIDKIHLKPHSPSPINR